MDTKEKGNLIAVSIDTLFPFDLKKFVSNGEYRNSFNKNEIEDILEVFSCNLRMIKRLKEKKNKIYLYLLNTDKLFKVFKKNVRRNKFFSDSVLDNFFNRVYLRIQKNTDALWNGIVSSLEKVEEFIAKNQFNKAVIFSYELFSTEFLQLYKNRVYMPLYTGGIVNYAVMEEIIKFFSSEKVERIRNNQFKRFRDSVLQRDGYKCVLCGNNKNLTIHHLKEVSKFPELQLDINNAVTLCEKCHKKIHSYENKENKEEKLFNIKPFYIKPDDIFFDFNYFETFKNKKTKIM